MQELISKEAVKEVFKTAIELPGAKLYFHDAIEALPTTVHHEYKVGDEAEFKTSAGWKTGIFNGYKVTLHEKDPEWGYVIVSPEIRQIQEHPDITQARELASKHGMILIPKE